MSVHNFCIIAHIDHGKSTLADRLLELTGTIAPRRMRSQVLDTMELEREKGITIKLQPVRMQWRGHTLHLIDTPGHVDFQYEVSRSLQAVEGAVLLVDATQGVQAQTLSNLHLAQVLGLTIIPVINKIDLGAADMPRATRELAKALAVGEQSVLRISAKTGEGVEQLLDTIVQRVPAAKTDSAGPLKALIFDSLYDDYKGVVAYVRVVEGKVAAGQAVTFLGTGASDKVVEAGIFRPELTAAARLGAGEIGYLATGLKAVRQARVGDTITHTESAKQVKALPGFTIPQPKVFASLYPEAGEKFTELREAIAKLQLSDASLTAVPERSAALGQGFRCGFLGMLHVEIVQERLKREYGMALIITTPSVRYQVTTRGGQQIAVETPAQWPDPATIETVREPYVRVELITPTTYLGAVYQLLKDREAVLVGQEQLDERRVGLRYELPLRELIVDLYDQLKSVSSGYASMSYEVVDWRPAEVVKLTVLVNHEAVEALSVMVARSKAERLGRRLVERLKTVLPRQLFAVPLQAAVGGQIMARETLPALRKDVTGHLYGGDVTRKKKLLAKQKKGKKRLAARGSVVIPPEAYMAILKRS